MGARICAESQSLLLEHEVHLHVCLGRLPHALHAFGARWLVVEVAWAVVAWAAVGEAVLKKVNGEESRGKVAVSEHLVLVILQAALAIEVNVEQLAGIQSLR